MIQLNARTFRIFLWGLTLLAAVAANAREGSIVISDYPTHQTQLSEVQLFYLRWYAGKIVDAVEQNERVEVLVIGHADIDSAGPGFELRISQERAANGKEQLQSLVSEEILRRKLPRQSADLVSYRIEGLGTRELIHPSPVNEGQRRQNRRIEIAWISSRPVAPPTPVPPSNKFEIRVVGGASVALFVAQADNYVFQIVDLNARKTAFFLYTGPGIGASIPKIPGPGSMTYAGPPQFFETTRPVELYQFNSKATLVQDAGATIGPVSVGGTLRLDIDGIIDSSGALTFTIPRDLAISGGAGIQMPGLGSKTTGVLTMISAIFPFNGY